MTNIDPQLQVIDSAPPVGEHLNTVVTRANAPKDIGDKVMVGANVAVDRVDGETFRPADFDIRPAGPKAAPEITVSSLSNRPVPQNLGRFTSRGTNRDHLKSKQRNGRITQL